MPILLMMFGPIAIVLVCIAFFLGLSHVAFGILLGVGLPILWELKQQRSLRPEPREDEPFYSTTGAGTACMLIGAICYASSMYVAFEHGLTVQELSTSREFSKFTRHLPFYSVGAITFGVVMIVMDLLEKGDEE